MRDKSNEERKEFESCPLMGTNGWERYVEWCDKRKRYIPTENNSARCHISESANLLYEGFKEGRKSSVACKDLKQDIVEWIGTKAECEGVVSIKLLTDYSEAHDAFKEALIDFIMDWGVDS